LIHGERRCLSSILAGKKEIAAKILEEKPSDLDIRLLQLIENVQREDLTLYETLLNIEQVISEYRKFIDQNVEMRPETLRGIINRSRTQCVNFLYVLSGGQELIDAIKSGAINNLEKAAIVAKAKTEASKSVLLQACLGGISLTQLKEISLKQKKVKAEDVLPQQENVCDKNRPGRKALKINLGSTQKNSVVCKLIELVLKDPTYAQFKTQFDRMVFDDFSACANAMSALIKLMEKIET
jgi:ParB family chromosome partitioning protein